MVHEISEVHDFTSSLSPAQNNVADQKTSVGAGVSDSSAMDGLPIQIVSPAGNKVERSKEAGESLKIGVPDDGGDVNEEKEKGATEGGREDEDFIVYLNNKFDDEDEEDVNNTSDGDDDDEDEEGEEEKGAAERGSEDEDFIVYLNKKSEDEDYIVYLNKKSDDDDEDEEDEGEDEDVYKVDLMEEDDEDGGVENKVDDLDEGKEGDRTIEEGSGKKEKEDERGVSLAPEVEKLKKKKVIKKVVSRRLDKVIVRNKDKLEGDEKNEPLDEEKGNKKEKVEEKGEGSLKKEVKRLRKGDRKKVISGSSEKAAPKPKNTLNSKHRKKGDSKRAESMGMIFMCSSKTKQDCYRYHVLGLPAGKRNIVEKIYKGMRLFLYDVDLKLLYGIYKATGRGGYNIEPKAFNSKFPSQVRFTILEDCIPLAEEKFRKVIKDNYFTKKKFDCQLKHEQVKNLCKLFLAASKGSKSKRLDRSHKAKAQASIHRDRSRAQGMDERRRSGLDENHRRHDYFHVREREVVASPVARVSQVAPIPPPIVASRYGYDRTLERDAYRQNTWEEHRDPYRQPSLLASQEEHRDPYRQPLLASRDAYRRQPLSEYRDLYRREPPLDHYDGYRRDGAPEHCDLQPMNLPVRHRNEIARHDPYGFFRERQSYRGAAYIEHLPAEPDRYHAVPTEYRARGAPISDYRLTGGLHRY